MSDSLIPLDEEDLSEDFKSVQKARKDLEVSLWPKEKKRAEVLLRSAHNPWLPKGVEQF